LRLSELVGIDIDHITDNVLSVIGKGDKQRTVPLDEKCIKAINAYLNVRPDIAGEKALFLSERKQRISKRTIQSLVKKYIGEAGLDTEKLSVHKLRHTSLSLMYKGGAGLEEIRKLAGHTVISTTQIYTHVDDDDLKKAVNANPLND
jgi:integrase/recombinase XerD